MRCDAPCVFEPPPFQGNAPEVRMLRHGASDGAPVRLQLEMLGG